MFNKIKKTHKQNENFNKNTHFLKREANRKLAAEEYSYWREKCTRRVQQQSWSGTKKISKLKDRWFEIIQSEIQKEKRMTKI